MLRQVSHASQTTVGTSIRAVSEMQINLAVAASGEVPLTTALALSVETATVPTSPRLEHLGVCIHPLTIKHFLHERICPYLHS